MVTQLTPEKLDALSVAQLEAAVRHHNRLYWDENAPEISDYDFDRLVQRLTQLSPDSPALREMGANIDASEKSGASVTHTQPMLSLDKCYDDEQLFKWADKIEGDFFVTPKLDGIAASIRYDERGRLALAATRGSGTVGEDITANVLRIEDIPNKLVAPGNLNVSLAIEVRGEIYMRRSVFAEFDDKFSNPRNLAAGAIKQKDPDNTRGYQLSFAPYDLIDGGNKPESWKFFALDLLQFRIVDFQVVSPNKLRNAYEHFAKKRESLDYEIDGVVFKANEASEQDRLGATAHHPRYAIAYKFQGDVGTSVLEQLEWSVARTGTITPVARITPVTLSGASVSRASLHHAGFVDKLGLTLGAEVEVTRRGGVIPKVERVLKPGMKPVALPERCPGCDGPLQREGDFLYCVAPAKCRAARIGTIVHYCKVIDMQGFGEKFVTQAYDAGLLCNIEDLYSLEISQLTRLERVGEKSANNLVQQVASHRTLPLATFLRALGIDELSKHVSALLSERYGTLEKVRELDVDELSAIHTIGPAIATAVVTGLKERAALIDTLAAKLSIASVAAQSTDAGPFSGQSFVFTGTLTHGGRKEAQVAVQNLGGSTPSSVTKDLTFLVVGDGKTASKSSKQVKAEKQIAQGAKTKILSESEFLALIK